VTTSTVVFADLTGSTGVFESQGNAKATQVITQLTSWISDVFALFDGRVIKTLGDGVLAVFPQTENAIRAMVQIQRTHQRVMQTQPLAERLPIRAGIATGELEFVKNDCFGDAVNIASRLNDLCGPNEIWVNSPDLDLSHRTDGLKFRLLGPIRVRGRADPCSVYQIEWNEDQHSEFLTMQAGLDQFETVQALDTVEKQIELTYKSSQHSFPSFALPVQIGRDEKSDFVVNDLRVSRTHARLEWRKGSVMLVDVSSYGSWIRFEGGVSDIHLHREASAIHGRGEISLRLSFSVT
jgi:class 3 adenylate cyclase